MPDLTSRNFSQIYQTFRQLPSALSTKTAALISYTLALQQPRTTCQPESIRSRVPETIVFSRATLTRTGIGHQVLVSPRHRGTNALLTAKQQQKPAFSTPHALVRSFYKI